MRRCLKSHLRDLLCGERRCTSLVKEVEGIYCDLSRQRMTSETLKVRAATPDKLMPTVAWPFLQLLVELANAAKLREKIGAMFSGDRINVTEDRAVLHVALRARRDQVIGEPKGHAVRCG